MKYLITIPILVTTLSTNAEVITDGTLGQQQNLPGPNFQITPDLGQQHGENLFHSFQDFNLNSSESATFSGPNNIQNILSRVTGGNPSNIDGLIRSTIPNANFYFLNPYGIMFGPNARLDVQGSFHASTADYLRLGENGRFDARYPNNSILTVAPVEAFGFLNNTVAPISVEGYGEIASVNEENEQFGLTVPENQTLSLIGGDIKIRNGSFVKEISYDDDGTEEIEAIRQDSLHAPGGRINLVAIDSTGEIILKDGFLDISSFSKLANILITEQSLLKVSGEGSGNLFIRGQDITFQDSQIVAMSSGDIDNGVIDIHSNGSIRFQDGTRIYTATLGKGQGSILSLQAGENVELSGENIEGSHTRISQWTASKDEGAGDAGTLSIKAKNLSIDGSDVTTWTSGKGNAGDIIVQVEEKLYIGGDNPSSNEGSRLYSSPFSSSTGGNSGSILIEAKDISIMDGSYISGTAFGPGNGANITVHATGTVRLAGVNDSGYASGFFANTNPLRKSGAKNAGDIIVEAGELIIEKGAMISSSTIARKGLQSGQGGNITINVAGAINLSGVNLYGENEEGLGSGIFVYSRSVGGQAGDAGNMLIESNSLSITEGAGISSGTDSSAQGGNIIVNINDSINISGDSSNIKLGVAPSPTSSQSEFQKQFPEPRLSISGIYANSSESLTEAGNAGNLTIQARKINLTADGTINTSTQNASGGSIMVKASDLLYLNKGKITTSVSGGEKAGGNINIENPTFVVLNQGQIKAQADKGHGGNISIKSEQFITTSNSLISASSNLGLDGEVNVESLDVDVEGFLVVLADEVVEASSLMKQPCSMRGSSFTVQKIAGSPQTPYDYQPSTYLPEIDKKVKTVSKKTDEKLAFSICKTGL
ncbi:filamentous hemagglutinin N-terminal domain-containing protein [Candidatus Halobeggiatoa sp. HSG11]|nr:filamentous hemagglutinin N-terminal domain-containing protein [Candidatus Halobeggiatoa sp. HSG11]